MSVVHWPVRCGADFAERFFGMLSSWTLDIARVFLCMGWWLVLWLTSCGIGTRGFGALI